MPEEPVKATPTTPAAVTLTATGSKNILAGTGDINIKGDVTHGNKTTIQLLFQQAVEKLTGSPYKFLSSYGLGDSAIFYGRNAVIEKIAGGVPQHKVLIVNGASGSGKTSLVNAGILPRLIENHYAFIYFREYSDPLAQVRDYLRGKDLPDLSEDASLVEIMTAFRAKQKAKQAAGLVVVFDQFERFLVNVPLKERRAFIGELKACMAAFSAEEMNVVFVLRKDSLGLMYAEIEEVIPEFGVEAHRFHLKALGRAEAREAIIRPLDQVEAKIGYDEAFVDKVLLESLAQKGEQDTISPPHLQIVCHQLFEAAHKRLEEKGGAVVIDEAMYDELGGVEKILNSYLDRTVEEIAGDPEKVAVVRSMLYAMVEAAGPRKRKFVSLEDLGGALPDVNEEVIRKLLEKLSMRRVVEADQESKQSLSSDYMVGQVRSWFDVRELEPKKARETLDGGLAAWQTSQSLLDERQVAHIRQWLEDLSEDEKALLAKSQAAYEKRRRWTRIASVSIAFLAVIASVLAVVGWTLREQADTQAKIADSRRLAAQAQLKLDSQRDLALLLSVAAYEIHPTFEAQRILLNALHRSALLDRFLNHHQTGVNSVAFSLGGKQMASGSDDGTIIFWDVDSGIKKDSLIVRRDSSVVYSVAFSPDGRRLASWSNDNLTLWNLETDSEQNRQVGAKVNSVAFSPNGRYLAYGSIRGTTLWSPESESPPCESISGNPAFSVAFSPARDSLLVVGSFKKVILWDLRNCTSRTLYEHQGRVMSVAFSPDGKHLASGSDDDTIILWNLETDSVERTLTTGAHVRSVAFSPDGLYLAYGSDDTRVILWDLDSGIPVDTLTGHAKGVNSVAFSADGKHLASGSDDTKVILWDLVKKTSPLVQPLQGNEGGTVKSVTYDPDNERLASADWFTEKITLWDVGADSVSQKTLDVRKDSSGVNSIAFSLDGERLASGWDDGKVFLWDLDTGSAMDTLVGHTKGVNSVAFSADGKHLASGSADRVILWDLTNTPMDTLVGHTKGVNSVAFSADGKHLASGSADRVILWDLTNTPMDTLVEHAKGANSVAFSHDGKHLASGSADRVILWDLSGTPMDTLVEHAKGVNSVAFSFGDTLLASGSDDGTIILWNLETDSKKPLTTGAKGLNSVAFSPDGLYLAYGSDDGTIGLWNLAIGERLGQLRTRAKVHSVAFILDGKKLAAGMEAEGKDNNTVILWDLNLDSWQKRARCIANRNLTSPEKIQYNIGKAVAYKSSCP